MIMPHNKDPPTIDIGFPTVFEIKTCMADLNICYNQFLFV